MIWFTSDTHFGHANVLGFCNRPWDSIEAMNKALIDAINARVAPSDTLYHLGDFSFKMTTEDARNLRGHIWCRDIHWVPGNHDKDWSQRAVAGTFVVEPPIATLKLGNGQKVVMCHYPIMDWPGFGHGSIHLHGHIHAPREYNEWNRRMCFLRYDVGVDANGYAPVSMDEVLGFFKGVEHRHRVTREQWEGCSQWQGRHREVGSEGSRRQTTGL